CAVSRCALTRVRISRGVDENRKGLDLAVFIVAGREDNDGQLLRGRLRAQETAQGESVNAGHFDIEHDEIAMLFVQQAESLGRVRRDENAMSRALENLAQTTTHARFVINDEQRGGRSDVAGRS